MRHAGARQAAAPHRIYTLVVFRRGKNKIISVAYIYNLLQPGDCPKRQKAKDTKGNATTGRAALVGADATADENLDVAIGNVPLAADAQPRSVNIVAALCVRSHDDDVGRVTPLTPAELGAQDQRELAFA
eukprot:6188439-Pleurochrysis_carterae.AAC.3